jgi:hypothetical protein
VRRVARRPVAIALAWLAAIASTVGRTSAQEPASTTLADRPLVTTFDAGLLADLPTSDSLFTVVEQLQPSIISDRFTAGGLDTARPARLGGFLSSWTETEFLVDGVPITDPTGSGTPLLLPALSLWDRVTVGTGLFGRDARATGLTIDVAPRVPGNRWTRQVEVALSNGLAGDGSGASAPPIARLELWDRAAFTASGPLADRLGLTVAATWATGSQFERADVFPVKGRNGSALAHLVLTPNGRDSIRTLGWLQRRESPLAGRTVLGVAEATTAETAGHAQVVWSHGGDARLPFRASASYTGRRRTADYAGAAIGRLERLVDGPVEAIGGISSGTVQTWSLGLQGRPSRRIGGRTHDLLAGVDATGGRSATPGFFRGAVGELVNGIPARVWAFDGGRSSVRRGVTFGAFADDTLALSSRLSVQAGLRFQAASGSARGTADGIGWRTLLPSARAQWTPTDWWQLTTFTGYSRSAYRLALDDLAVGDPGAPTADIYRWNATGATSPVAATGPLVARVGPGTGGSRALSAIDPALRVPTADEFVLGMDVRPTARVLLRVAGTLRRERHLLGVVNTGAPASTAYRTFTVNDPGGNVLSPDDDRVLTIYDRLPASFGRDRYLLTNPVQPDATFKGVEITIRVQTDRLLLAGGATAGIAESTAAARGFGPVENDQGVVGETFANPNAGALARGRPFTDRAYTGKFAAVYAAPAKVRVGLVARYQDGQPFSRVLVFPQLAQGAEAVRAFTAGESRFMFVGTLDLRVQRRFTIGGYDVNAFLDVFNLPGMSNSVEEDVSERPDVRVPTATQPPRAVHLGMRVGF